MTVERIRQLCFHRALLAFTFVSAFGSFLLVSSSFVQPASCFFVSRSDASKKYRYHLIDRSQQPRTSAEVKHHSIYFRYKSYDPNQRRVSKDASSSPQLHALQQEQELRQEREQQQRKDHEQESTAETTNHNDSRKFSFQSTHGSVVHLLPLMVIVACMGAVETAYLTVSKVFHSTQGLQSKSSFFFGMADVLDFCPTFTIFSGSSSSCSSVLNGPYSVVPGTDVPLALLGFFAYSTVLLLSSQLLMTTSWVSSSSRIATDCYTTNSNTNANKTELSMIDKNSLQKLTLLKVITTCMAIASIWLMGLLFNVLHEMCLFCFASAFFSMTLASLTWTTTLDEDTTNKSNNINQSDNSDRRAQFIGIFERSTPASALLATVLAMSVILASTESPLVLSSLTQSSSAVATTAFFARTNNDQKNDQKAFPDETKLTLYAPPAVTTSSSPEAMALAKQLESLQSKFYGAYWCSHCFEQKQTLGKQAMALIPYVECARDGINSERTLCQEKNVPGYPTWEISGSLYPGERSIVELEEIVQKYKSN